MSNYSYNKILDTAKTVQKNVKTDYKTKVHNRWCYYFAKSILNPKKNITTITVNDANDPTGTYISNQIKKADYIDVCKRLTVYVEKNKRLPNYVTYSKYKLTPHLLVEVLSRILVWYSNNGKLPSQANINSKVFNKPTESKNEVYDYFVKKTGLKPKYLDDVCDWARDKVTYQFYFDDKKSNKEVIDSKAGNCTDLLQMLVNMAKALGYEWKVIHTECKQSGTGHVYGMFRKSGDWFIRDIACIADESRYCVWCQVPNGGNKLAENPSWFMQNLNR